MATGTEEPLDLGEIEPGNLQSWESRGVSVVHLFDGERCVHCHVNVYDIGVHLDEDFPCIEHPLTVYTTETPSA